MKTEATFIPMFRVFKQGVTTEGPVTILKKSDEPFNEEWKRKKFLMLGYTITEITQLEKFYEH